MIYLNTLDYSQAMVEQFAFLLNERKFGCASDSDTSRLARVQEILLEPFREAVQPMPQLKAKAA